MLPLLWLLPLGAALAAPAAPPPPRTTFCGHLAHAPAGDTVRLWVGTKQVKTPLSASGDFRFELNDLTEPTAVNFSYAKQQTHLYLLPGDQLVMHLDFPDFDKTLTYSGVGANASNYFAQAGYQFEYGPAGAVPRLMEELRKKPDTTPAEMRRTADAYRQARLAYLARYAQAHPLPPAARQYAQFAIDLKYGMDLLNYVSHYRAQAPAGAGPAVVPETYFSFLPTLPLKTLSEHLGRGLDEGSLAVWLLYAYQYRLAPAGALPPSPAVGPRLYELATQELGNTKARDLAMLMLMNGEIANDIPGALALYPTFRAHNTDSATARSVRQALALRQRLGVGKPAPAFTLVNDAGQPVSLSDFKGQVIYLDFWGTWCPPCMREMAEFAPALKKKFAGRDVVFLYIAVDQNQVKWRQTLTEQHFTSANAVHLYERDGKVAADYQMNGYPSYYLIGRDGRFIKLWTVRPSDGEQTVAAIEEALRQ